MVQVKEIKMKKILLAIILLIFSLSVIPVVDAGKSDKRSKKRQTFDQQYDRGYTKNHGPRGGYDHGWGHHKKNKHRRYDHRSPKYHNRGHWNSWDKWDRHYRRNHHKYRDGKYDRDRDGFLRFRFCDGEGFCFSFSIKD